MAFYVNVLGAKHVGAFARKCTKLKMLLHVSTGTCFIYIYPVVHTSKNGGELYNTMSIYMIGQLQHNHVFFYLLAFVAGTQEGLLLEKALKMGESLQPGYHLDIEAELQLVEKVKTELTASKSGSSDQSSEKTAMKELGLKRSGHLNVSFPLFYKYKLCFQHLLTNLQL